MRLLFEGGFYSRAAFIGDFTVYIYIYICLRTCNDDEGNQKADGYHNDESCNDLPSTATGSGIAAYVCVISSCWSYLEFLGVPFRILLQFYILVTFCHLSSTGR